MEQPRNKGLVSLVLCTLMVTSGLLGAIISPAAGSQLQQGEALSDRSAASSDTQYWAVLICGSDDFNAGFETDIRDMYVLLTQNLSYNPDYIYYVAPANWNSALHYYTDTKANIQSAFQAVAARAAATDDVFVLFEGHGTHDPWTIAPNVSPADLDGWLDTIDPCWIYGLLCHCQQMVVLLQSCYCGGFITTITQHQVPPNVYCHRQRLVITSTDSLTSSWSDMNGNGDPAWDPNSPDDDGNPNNPVNGNWDGSEFCSGFRMAHRDVDGNSDFEADDNPYMVKPGYNPDITAPNGDHNGIVSVKEAFQFSKYVECYSVYWQSYVLAHGWLLEYPQFWDPITWGDPNGIDPATTYIYSRAPAKPSTPAGTTHGSINTEYPYTSSATDPDGDRVYLLFDWGDGSTSGWVGPFTSGATGTASHTWQTKGDYQIKVKAKDVHGVEGPWSDPLPITMPVAFADHQTPIVLRFLERHPHLFPLLQRLLGI